MPSLSAQYDPAIGPLINLFLSPPAVMKQMVATTAPGSATSPAPPSSPSGIVAASALIDTGASITSVTSILAAQVGLPLIGKRNLQTAGGTISANVYVADIAVPFGTIPAGAAGAQVHVANVDTAMLENVIVMEFQCASPNFNMLLGRDILCRGIFSIGFDRRYTFSL